MKVGKLGGIVIIIIVILSGYAIYWLHLNPLLKSSGEDNITITAKSLRINASTFNSTINSWKPVRTLRTPCVGDDVRVCVGIGLEGMRNVGGTEIRLRAPTVVSVDPKNSSVSILRVELKVSTSNNTWFGYMVPEDFTGFPLFKSLEGPFSVEARWCGDPNRFGCMVAVPEKPAWGKRLIFDAWPHFTVDGKPPDYSGNATFTISVEYEIRIGPFTAEKKKFTVRVPLKMEFYGLSEST
ncbi:hypothetical protein [Thermococcus sp.]